MTHDAYPLYRARYHVLNRLPEWLWCGERLLLTIEITNDGLIPWLNFGPHPVTIAYRWQARDGSFPIPDASHTHLPRPVAPGQSVRVELVVLSPPTPGDYHLHVDLIEEQVAWFSEKQSSPLVIPMTYRPNTAPRATLVNNICLLHDAVGHHIVTQMRILRDLGYHVVLIAQYIDPRLPEDIRRSSIEMYRPDFETPNQRCQWALSHFFHSDLVIIHYPIFYDMCRVITLAYRSTVIFDYHGVTPPELWDPAAPGYEGLIRGQRNLSLVQYADYGIGHSEFTANELRQTGCIAPERVRVMPYAVVAQSRYATCDDEGCRDLVRRYKSRGEIILLYVGRMARNKRIIDLVEAMPYILARYPTTVLLLVGDNQLGPYRDYANEIQQRIDELGYDRHIIFTGQVPDLEPYYALCDVFVTASAHEGFCMPVVEAMAHGKPVVAANATAIPGTLGDAGILFEPYQVQDLAEKVVAVLDLRKAQQSASAPTISPMQASTTALDERIRNKRIVFVTPRYGLDVLGGAEGGMRGWAEQLVSRGYRVEVLTTCVKNMARWENHYPPGMEIINGVPVHRFPMDPINMRLFHDIHERVIRGDYVRYQDEQQLMQNNLQSSQLIDYLRQHADDIAGVIFSPYLFGTTYWGVRAIPDKALLVPCLHDEPLARLEVFREMLEDTAGIFFNTRAEQDFATQVLGVANPNHTIIGYGFDPTTPTGNAERFSTYYHIQPPILLYSGRLENHKNVPLLFEYFIRYKLDHPGPLTLVLAGSGDIAVPERNDIVSLGMITDQQVLADVYAAATVLCQPSTKESFSLVILESWVQRRPVLVHAQCGPTSEHVRASGGGYAFDTYEQFAMALHRLLNDAAHANELGERGRRYVEQHYRWELIIHRIVDGIATYTAPHQQYTRLTQRGIRRALAFTPKRFSDALLQLVEEANPPVAGYGHPSQGGQLDQAAQIGQPTYQVRSSVPIIGPLIAWVRRHLTAHLREPYLDPIVARQEHFYRQFIHTVLPVLRQQLAEQRHLRQVTERLQEALEHALTRKIRS